MAQDGKSGRAGADMKLKTFDHTSAVAVVVGVVIVAVGLLLSTSSRAGILDFPEHKTQAPSQESVATGEALNPCWC